MVLDDVPHVLNVFDVGYISFLVTLLVRIIFTYFMVEAVDQMCLCVEFLSYISFMTLRILSTLWFFLTSWKSPCALNLF